jgi:transmembrane sensor
MATMHPSPDESARGKATRSVLDWPAQAGAATGVLLELKMRARRRHHRRVTVAVACAFLIAAAVTWRAPWRSTPASSIVVLRPEQQILADGSIIELKSGAEISVLFTPERRNVELKRGEAHFQVAKNKARPFVVTVDGLEVRAVGTAFNVRRVDAGVEVLVTEGTVAVDEPKQSRTVSLVDAGRRVMVPASMAEDQAKMPVGHAALPRVMEVLPAEVAQELSWLVPRLEFSGTSLGEALPMFNRFSRVQLTLGDASLSALQVSGIVRADNVDALLRLLETNFDIRAERRGETELILHRGR